MLSSRDIPGSQPGVVFLLVLVAQFMVTVRLVPLVAAAALTTSPGGQGSGEEYMGTCEEGREWRQGEMPFPGARKQGEEPVHS